MRETNKRAREAIDVYRDCFHWGWGGKCLGDWLYQGGREEEGRSRGSGVSGGLFYVQRNRKQKKLTRKEVNVVFAGILLSVCRSQGEKVWAFRGTHMLLPCLLCVFVRFMLCPLPLPSLHTPNVL